MARGRMVNKKISNDKRVNDMPLQSQLLFTWLIAHLDCNGRFYGSAQMVKSLVIPRKNWSKRLVEKCLTDMENSKNANGTPLIRRYTVNGECYLFMPGFSSEQIGLRYDKEKPEFPTSEGKNTEKIGQTVSLRGREEEEEEEDKDEGKYSYINNIYALYEGEIGKLSPSITEELKGLQGEWPFPEIQRAFKIAAMNNKRSLGYVKGILKKEGKKDAPASLLAGLEE